MKPKCEDCYYWEHKHDEPEGGQGRKIGACHRWPEPLDKFDYDWCGEFKPIKPEYIAVKQEIFD